MNEEIWSRNIIILFWNKRRSCSTFLGIHKSEADIYIDSYQPLIWVHGVTPKYKNEKHQKSCTNTVNFIGWSTFFYKGKVRKMLPAGLLESGQGDKIWVAVWTDNLTAHTSATDFFIWIIKFSDIYEHVLKERLAVQLLPCRTLSVNCRLVLSVKGIGPPEEKNFVEGL